MMYDVLLTYVGGFTQPYNTLLPSEESVEIAVRDSRGKHICKTLQEANRCKNLLHNV